MTTQITHHSLPRSTPEAQGIPSEALLAFLDDAERKDLGLHSLMVLRHSHVVAEGWWNPYGPAHPHMLFSLSKSFASTAAGLAATEGVLSLDDLVVSFFPDDLPTEIDENLAAMRVRHLLSMSTGHAEDTTGRMRDGAGGDWVKGFLAQPVAHAPGTHFVYNSGATYMVSAIVQKATGQTLLDYLRPRLFDPLGITGQTWESSPQGINVGGWGLNIKTEDILRFGQLYLQKGIWQDERLLMEAWVAEATSKQISNGTDPDNDWAAGYGFQFWRCRHGAYRGDGAFGQLCVVLPDQNTVVAMTAGTRDLGGVLNLIWEHLLPAFSPTALPENVAAQAQLADKLAHLSLSVPQGERTLPVAARVSGKTYRFPASETLTSAAWDFQGDNGAVLILTDQEGEHRIPAGTDDWQLGTTNYGGRSAAPLSPNGHAGSPIAVHGAWTGEDTYALTICFYETPFVLTLTARFTDDRVLLETRQNVSFGPTEQPPLEGQA
jgi:CubicO group peptidase (beta-lactamase class C family)